MIKFYCFIKKVSLKLFFVNKINLFTGLVFIFFGYIGCQARTGVNEINTAEQLAHLVADFIVSIDDISAGQTSISSVPLFDTQINTFKNNFNNKFPDQLVFQLSTCQNVVYSTCSASGTRVKDFAGCTLLGKQFNGEMNFLWLGGDSSNTCSMGTLTGSSVVISSEYSATFEDGVVAQVKTTGQNGMSFLWVTGTGSTTLDPKIFEFSTDGLRRSIEVYGKSYFDATLTTATNIQVNGHDRDLRVLSGGPIYLKNSANEDSCSMTFNQISSPVIWNSSCNCPISGEGVGSCSNTGSIRLQFLGCGRASIYYKGKSKSVNLDRCFPI